MKSKLKIERGSGNVFEDLGFAPGEAENLRFAPNSCRRFAQKSAI